MTDDRINRAVANMKAKVEALKTMQRIAAEGRRYRSGSFNLTKDIARSYRIASLLDVIEAFES